MGEPVKDAAFCWLQGIYSHLTPRFSHRSHLGVPPVHCDASSPNDQLYILTLHERRLTFTCRLRHSVQAIGVLLLRITGVNSDCESAAFGLVLAGVFGQ